MDETTSMPNQSATSLVQDKSNVRSSSIRIERTLTSLFSHLVLLIFTVIIVYPVVWMVFASFKSNSELVTNVWGLPTTLQWTNYTEAWITGNLGYALINSVVTSLGVTVVIIVVASTAAFAFARMTFRGALVIFLIMIFTMQAPTPIIPLYVMLVKMRLTDSRIGLILPMAAGGLPLSIFIFRAFFQSIPGELLDAAKVDGCTNLTAFLRVVIPISGPAIATVAILMFVGAWNDYFLPLILIRSAEMRTIPLAIQVFFYAFGRTEWEQVFAALTIASLPMIIIYIIMQRQFIQGLTAGSVKG
jgi:raffinose/stachyose/melibiose transport system permease protein